MGLEDLAKEVGLAVLLRAHVVKVVGVGSVGTRCAVALLLATDDDPLLLQIKEARPSVLEPYAGKSDYADPGQRIVTGQLLMQSASEHLPWLGARGGWPVVRISASTRGSAPGRSRGLTRAPEMRPATAGIEITEPTAGRRLW